MLQELRQLLDPANGKQLEDEADLTSMIVLVGETGVGKSHFINAIAPGRCKESPRLDSCTQSPAAIDVVFDGKPLILIDTPGFNDTRSRLDRSDAVILEEIATLIAIQSALGVKMKGILYLHDIMAPRMTGEALRQLGILQRICGEDSWSHVTLVTTKWPPDELQQRMELGVREGGLRRDYWRNMIRNGAKMFRFQDTPQSATTIVRSLTQQQPIEFALQKEMAAGKSLLQTSAGRFIINERENDQDRYEQLQKELKAHPEDTRLASDARALGENLKKRKENEAKLGSDNKPAEDNEAKNDMRSKLKRKFEETGEKPTIVVIMSWLLSMGSIAINIIQFVG